jgi:hypothetical protein
LYVPATFSGVSGGIPTQHKNLLLILGNFDSHIFFSLGENCDVLLTQPTQTFEHPNLDGFDGW